MIKSLLMSTGSNLLLLFTLTGGSGCVTKQREEKIVSMANFDKMVDSARFLENYPSLENSTIYSDASLMGTYETKDYERYSFFDSAAKDPHLELFYMTVYSWPTKLIKRIKYISGYFSQHLPNDTGICYPIFRAFNQPVVKASIGGPDQKICLRNKDSSIYIWEVPTPVNYDFGPYDRHGYLIKLDKTGSNIVSLTVLDEFRNIQTIDKQLLRLGFPTDTPTTYSILLGLHYTRLFKTVSLTFTNIETLLTRDKKDSVDISHQLK